MSVPSSPSLQGRFAGSWSKLPLAFPALGAERGWLGTPFPSDPSHLVPSAPRAPRSRRREPGCDPWFGFNISYFWPSSILMAHADGMGSTSEDVAASRYLEIKGSSARCSSNLDDALSALVFPDTTVVPTPRVEDWSLGAAAIVTPAWHRPKPRAQTCRDRRLADAVCEEFVS